ncbi:hypothetical protein MACK_000438 [Theileria orientalis]|uniref:Uncharacterized protein n=1 Tax=Theileria orientalis TaxID=68886 RepID=A0A976QTZ4_THEOR|nr:hypothetical protein MACK_000438 [Theileria orientalis]
MSEEETCSEGTDSTCPHVKKEDTTSAFKCKAITAVASVALYIMFFQLDIISAQIAIGFDIPVHNTSIYLEKLFGIRFLTFFFGRVTEYIIFRSYSKVASDQGEEQLRYVRAQMNIAAFGVLLLGRVILFLVTCFSSNPAYHVYFALAFEAFGIGCSGAAFCSTYPRHCTVIILFAHVSRLVTFIVQFVLDRAFKNSMPKIKCQFFFCTLLSIVAVIGLYQYQHGDTGCKVNKTLADMEKKLVKQQRDDNATKHPEVHGGGKEEQIKETEQAKQEDTMPELGFIRTFGRAASPFFMYSAGSLFFDTLFPGILPYAFDTRERCHMINMIIPFAGVTGTILLVGLESADIYQKWLPELDAAWLIAIPMAIVFVYSILAVHTRIPSARKIIKNRPRIMAMTFTGALGNSFMDPLSFSGVIKVLFLSGFKPDVEVLLLHEITCILVRFYHYKISVGYNVTRINLGYILPKFRPNHRMSKWNTFWYILREMFRKAGRDAISDLTMNVKEYL